MICRGLVSREESILWHADAPISDKGSQSPQYIRYFNATEQRQYATPDRHCHNLHF